MTMNIDLQVPIMQFLAACEEAAAAWKDPALSAQGKEEKANQLLEAGTAHLQARLVQVEKLTSKAKAAADGSRTDFQALASVDEADRAWQAMAPYREQGWTVQKMALYAATPADLAAIATYARPYVTAAMVAQNDGNPVAPMDVDAALASLDKDLLDAMARLGINTDQRSQHAEHEAELSKLTNEAEYLKALITKQVHPGRLPIFDRVKLAYADPETSAWLASETSILGAK